MRDGVEGAARGAGENVGGAASGGNMADVAEAANALAALLERRGDKGTYTYEILNVKRWILGDGGRSGNCEICNDNADLGWIDQDYIFEGVDGDIDEPPAHPNCLLGDAAVTAFGVSAATKRKYCGEIIVLRIPGVDHFACTPNHPVLTERGWTNCRDVKRGDFVFQAVNPSAIRAVHPNDNHIESRIEKISDALLMTRCMRSGRMPISSVAFHGDVKTDAEVEIVWPYGALPIGMQSERYQSFKNRSFARRHLNGISFTRKGATFQVFGSAPYSANSIVGSFSPRLLLLGGELSRSHGRGFLDRAPSQPVLCPISSDYLATNADALRYGQDRLSGLVRPVQVAEVNVRDFSGQVYNLQTASNWYVADTIITHNCTCSVEFGERRKRVYA